jgi:hypothetical protein
VSSRSDPPAAAERVGMSLSLGSLASSAFDTARSTFKGLADAAVVTDSPEMPVSAAPAAAAPVRSEAKPVKGRVGTVLDAYA